MRFVEHIVAVRQLSVLFQFDGVVFVDAFDGG